MCIEVHILLSIQSQYLLYVYINLVAAAFMMHQNFVKSL